MPRLVLVVVSVNVTEPPGVPAGMPEPGATVAVNVTGWPTLTGLADDVSVVAVVKLTVSESEVLLPA